MNFTMRKIEILAILLIGILPVLWYSPENVIAKGDHFPYLLNIKSISNDFHLWSTSNFGNPSAYPAYSLYGLIWAFSQFLLINIELWQIIMYIFYFVSAAFSMFYLTKTIYSEESCAVIIAGIFYIFNFFILTILLNIGMIWTYAFLPLLMAFFIKIITKTQKTYTDVFCFALTFAFAGSISSMNIADVALTLIGLASVLFYYIIFERKIATRLLIKNLAVLLVVTVLLSMWWIVPILNYYLLSPSTQLQQEINVLSWSWTHARASFLNLFSLNGGWGWRPEYFPYYRLYTNNAILTFSLFIPFLLAPGALLFNGKKRKFNAYLMLIILLLIFLAKGLHEPLGFVNLFLYDHIPYMAMFREPISKFTLLMIPFLALLIGYSTDKIAKTLKHNIGSKLFIVIIISIFTISTFPMITNPIETKTEQIPYSTYVKIPQYWFETSEWLSNKTGDFKILVAPLDDYYQVPYSWGYYGSDSFIERLIRKPVISPCYAYSYKVNPNVIMLMNQLRDAMKYNRTEEFETIISLLNVKYILQRNDLDYEYMALTKRDIVNPEKMRNFLSTQPNVTLVKTIGELAIYEYIKAKPYVYILEPKLLQKCNIKIINKTILTLQWDFGSTNQLDEWKNTTRENQFGAICKLYLDNATLKFELWNSTFGWKTITSPLTTAQYEVNYNFKLGIKGENAHEVQVKIFEYDKKMELTHAEYVYYIADGTFNWKKVQIDYTPKIENTTFLQLMIWNGHETNKPLPNIIWIDNVKIHGYTTRLNTTGLNLIFQNSTQNQPATILDYQKINPTKITATINATHPFILAISEALDQSWKAHISGKQIENTPLYLGLKGFPINQTGLLEVVIEYEPQRWFFYGSIISVATLLACLTYLTYNWTKNKAFWKRIETTLRAR